QRIHAFGPLQTASKAPSSGQERQGNYPLPNQTYQAVLNRDVSSSGYSASQVRLAQGGITIFED
ncbi:MAG: hypothetical protein L7V32_00445, partial [Luminiphilus sp.]|nr:hypothetical protein [Luminiphilus sp.]